MQLGTGVKTMATEKLHTQGNVEQTGNQMDIAVNGRGFLQVTMPDGSITYTRDGQLKLDLNGQIVNANGLPLTPSMTIPQDALSITIGSDGTVSVLQPNNPQPSNVGQIQTANFINLAGLEPIGENLYRESGASGPPVIGTPGQQEFGAIVQNSLETSNVNVVEELVGMIETQRAYEMNSKAISTTDQMLSYATQNL
jgi:flagellar basal-body rod protein FlgG